MVAIFTYFDYTVLAPKPGLFNSAAKINSNHPPRITEMTHVFQPITIYSFWILSALRASRMTRRPNAAKISSLIFIAEAQSQARSAMTRRPNAAKTSLLFHG
ncbi:MAG: hypothetical protein HUK21_00805 [Fibrobacteraceae bacterium]|nr:hypothetical protein [Fibrobacteraceae bacterium]